MIDRQFLRKFNRDAIAALEKVADAHGVSIAEDAHRFTLNNATLKFKLSSISDEGKILTEEALAWKSRATSYGLSPEDLGGSFVTQSGKYKIVGLKPRRRKYPVSAVRLSDGKAFKFPVSAVTNVVREGTGRRAALADQEGKKKMV